MSKETPLPVYIGVMLHLKTRKGDLINRLYSLGMSISYDEVLCSSLDMANAVCEHFKETDTIFPPKLQKKGFTIVVDNGNKFISWHQHFTNTVPYCGRERCGKRTI